MYEYHFHSSRALPQLESRNHDIRRLVVSSRLVSTIAGTVGTYGHMNGIGDAASFFYPAGIAMDALGTFAVVVSEMNVAYCPPID